MKLCHCADLHLSHARYHRTSSDGTNQRSADVARTFSTMIDAMITERPDMVLVAGDIFDTASPTPRAVLHVVREFRRLVTAVPGVKLICVSGNHDEAKDVSRGNFIPLMRQFGAFAANRKPERFNFPDIGVSVLAVPECSAGTAVLEPNTAYPHNLLLIHTAILGTVPSEKGLRVEQLNAGRFDYVALGDFHQYTEIAPNAFYPGSIDYTSSDVWSEWRRGLAKGFIVRELESGSQRFVTLPTRAHLDLPVIDAARMSPAEIDQQIAVNAGAVKLDGAVVRQVVLNVSTAVVRSLDARQVRKLKTRALNYLLDTRRAKNGEDYHDGPLFAAMDAEIDVEDVRRPHPEESDPIFAACYGNGKLPAADMALFSECMRDEAAA